MRAVLQRVSRAQVRVDGEVVGDLPGAGLVALIGVTHGDTQVEALALARKIANLRIMADERSLLDGIADHGAGQPVEDLGAGAGHGSGLVSVLAISQFTLYADTRKGRRPSWSGAAPGPVAEPLVEAVVAELRALGLGVATGRFGAHMEVELVNDGPVTLLVDA